MKNYLKKLAMVAIVGMAGVGVVGADQFDKKTIVTIEEAMQLPHTTLQPGTYVIRLLNSPPERHIVQFFDKDEKHIIVTVNAIPNERLRPTGKTVFAFWEVPAGQPKALRAWFYPGDDFGQEFAYPKDQAARITASNSSAKVLIEEEKTTDSASAAPAPTSPTTAAATSEPEPSPAIIAAAEPAPVPAPVEVAAAPVQNTEVPQAASPTPATPDTSDAQRVTQSSTAPETLPKTASNLPMLGLIGLLSIVAAFALRFAYNRS